MTSRRPGRVTTESKLSISVCLISTGVLTAAPKKDLHENRGRSATSDTRAPAIAEAHAPGRPAALACSIGHAVGVGVGTQGPPTPVHQFALTEWPPTARP